MAFGLNKLLQGGLAGNYSQADTEALEKEYGSFLMSDEKITIGFKLIRDTLIFTDKRIIFTDRQGATGSKVRINSINLYSIIKVTVETAGFGLDDSEITFTYISSPTLKGYNVEYASHKLEFPKKFDVKSLYKLLQELAYENCLRLNDMI